jgi:outer membrane protein insertion porin family
VQLTNPGGTCVSSYPDQRGNPQCVQVPIPIYGVASIGGDTNFTSNIEYRIPIAGPVTFSLFDDFGIDTAFNKGQLKQSVEGFQALLSPLYGCPTVLDGACIGGTPGSQVGFKRNIHPIAGTNFVPRMSMGGEIAVIMPVINAPFRLYWAYNPLRLDERPYCNLGEGSGKNQSCNTLITPAMFPNATSNATSGAECNTNAGQYTYCQAVQGYGARNLFREPRKTFRLTVSTTF